MISIVTGFTGYLEGLRWLKSNPLYLLLLFVPIAIALVVLLTIWTTLFATGNSLIDELIPFEPTVWYLSILYYPVWLVFAVIMFVLSFIPSLLVASLLSSPFYEIVSCAVERDVRGIEIGELSWKQFALATIEECKKVAFILLVSLLMFFLVFIPIVNIFAFLILPIINAFLLGWDFCDYPLARRGWTFKRRCRFAIKNFFVLTGFGLWLLIPLQFLLAPLAVTGGTLLTLKHLPEE